MSIKIEKIGSTVVILEEQSNNNKIPHYIVIFDNKCEPDRDNLHIKMIWDNQCVEKTEIWINERKYKKD